VRWWSCIAKTVRESRSSADDWSDLDVGGGEGVRFELRMGDSDARPDERFFERERERRERLRLRERLRDDDDVDLRDFDLERDLRFLSLLRDRLEDFLRSFDFVLERRDLELFFSRLRDLLELLRSDFLSLDFESFESPFSPVPFAVCDSCLTSGDKKSSNICSTSMSSAIC